MWHDHVWSALFCPVSYLCLAFIGLYVGGILSVIFRILVVSSVFWMPEVFWQQSPGWIYISYIHDMRGTAKDGGVMCVKVRDTAFRYVLSLVYHVMDAVYMLPVVFKMLCMSWRCSRCLICDVLSAIYISSPMTRMLLVVCEWFLQEKLISCP